MKVIWGKFLESFSFEGFVLYKADKTDKKRQELALPPLFLFDFC